MIRLDAYYEGEQPLSFMHPEVQAIIGDRVRQVCINWPRLVVGSVEERLDVEGFRYADNADSDKDLWDVWQSNGLDELSQQAHVDSLVFGSSYAMVSTNPEAGEPPLVTVESPLQMVVDRDPKTRKIRAALKQWIDIMPQVNMRVIKVALYLPDGTYWYRLDQGSYILEDSDEHGLGVVPVVALVNRGRLLRPDGASELTDVLPLADAANKIATDMMVSAEFHAMPRRWSLGMEEAIDTNGQPVTPYKQIAGHIWENATSTIEGAAFGQFPEAQLTNFHATLEALAKLVASLTGLPPHYLGMATDNPASADAIRSSEARLVKTAERKQRAWGESWESVMRLVLRFANGSFDEAAESLETIWRDASTPTIAQSADAALKLHTAGITTLHQTREDLGYSAVQIERMEADDAAAVVSGVLPGLFGPPVPTPTPKPPAEPMPMTMPAVPGAAG